MNRKLYDKYYRNKGSKRFYNSEVWRKTKEMKLNQSPLCEYCRMEGKTIAADVVHHLVPVKQDGEHNLDLRFLVSLCHGCHNAVESEMEKKRKEKEKV